MFAFHRGGLRYKLAVEDSTWNAAAAFSRASVAANWPSNFTTGGASIKFLNSKDSADVTYPYISQYPFINYIKKTQTPAIVPMLYNSVNPPSLFSAYRDDVQVGFLFPPQTFTPLTVEVPEGKLVAAAAAPEVPRRLSDDFFDINI